MIEKYSKIILILSLPILLLLAWSPWLDNKDIHDRVLREKGWKDRTITTPENFINLPDEELQRLLEESKKKGVKNGILVCDYEVRWIPFGRLVVSCEGAYFVTFWNQILF